MRAHRTDLVSFVFGLLFLALAAWWLLAQVLGLVLPPVGWFLAGGLILIGLLGLLGALRSTKQADQPEQPGPAAEGYGGPQVATDPDLRSDEDHTLNLTEEDRTLLTGEDRTLDLIGEEPPTPQRRGPTA
ncbi:hypothetical protein [Micromonospora sp. DT229]|uniref:hypothetical protein n=1 Tax=Micromonospora sp. DT229 TaxID=3393430 RepID=UPI003CFBB77F